VSIRAIDLFCGGGGSSWGARQAGVEMVGAVDAWHIATETYEDNFPSARGNVVNVRLDDDSGPHIFKDLKSVDLIIASPECTHHSIARGARPRNEESRRSGWYVMRFIEEMRPRWVVLENVSPMANWPGFEELIARLRACGYCITIQKLNAAHFGVPQSRKRLFITCDRLRQPDVVEGRARHARPASGIVDPKGTWATNDLYIDRRAASTIERAENGIRELGKGKDFLVVYYGSDRAGGWQSLDRPLRTLTTLDRFGLIQWFGRKPTLRMLQIPEIKRAMGLPARFHLDRGTRRDKVKLLGNGVCGPVMRDVVVSLTRERSHHLMAAE
jgi:DNA (cytosine-5)-methyltransferase 1